MFQNGKLRFDARMAEAEAEKQHSARRLFLESYSPSDDKDGLLLAFMEESVVEAEMERTRTPVSVDEHIHKCVFCSRANSNWVGTHHSRTTSFQSALSDDWRKPRLLSVDRGGCSSYLPRMQIRWHPSCDPSPGFFSSDVPFNT